MTPQRASVALVAVRLLLCGIFVVVAGGWWLLWLLPLMQYIGFMHYGTKIGLGLLALSFGIFLVGMLASIKSPTDAAGLLMLEMSHLDQEHFRTVLLDTKNRVQTISTTIHMQSAPAHRSPRAWPCAS